MSEIKKCPKCGGEMEVGYLPGAWNWYYGRSLWSMQRIKRIFGYACKKCGYVEFYLERNERESVES